MSRVTQRVLVLVLVVVVVGIALLLADRARDVEEAGDQVAATETVGTEAAAEPIPVVDTERDREIFQETMAWARAERLDTLPIGEIIARLGETYVGTPYVAQTLEIEGPERLVINLRALDCVTYVENMLAMARLIREGKFDDYDAYTRELLRIRYRDGILDGYPSRIHYFSEWIANGEEKGLVRNITRELGGDRDLEKIDFMTSNADAYPKLADPENVEAMREVEERVTRLERYVIPEDRIADVESQIQDGDIIAATSTIDGLDITHTGIALWRNGRLHLMHAPLVGKSVEISERPLAERIQGIRGQDGIMVARPL